MKKSLVLFSILCHTIKTFGQCAHNPTINPIAVMCPSTYDTLWTQTYDSYQWYMNGNPVGNSTNQYFVVNSNIHSGSSFYVAATLNGCTQNSPQFFVDSWLFLPVTVMTIGNLPSCIGDSVLLVLNPPYELSIQWTDNGSPIFGANDDSLYVTNNGVYNVTAAPTICPNYVQSCVNIPISFINCSTSQEEITSSVDKMNIFPNPFTNQINFDLPGKDNFNFELYDQFGKLHFRGIIPSDSKEVDVSELPTGIYFVVVKSPNSNPKYFKLVKN
ncbi:MAG: T9SS type A sorting domain-containing protein [Bacteroidota bacterium]